MIRSALMTVMTNAAIKAGRGLKRDFGEIEKLQVSTKGPGDFVSLADKRLGKGAVRGAFQGAPRLRLRDGGRRARRGRRQEPHLAHRSARRDHQLPPRHPDLRGLDRAGARGPDRRRRRLQSRRRRHVRRRKGAGRLRGDNRRLRVAGAARNVAGADRLRRAASGQGARASALQGRARGGDDAGGQRPPPRLRLARSRLRRRRAVRRLLGARPQFLGHRGRRAADPRGRRLRQRTPTARRTSSRPARSAPATRRCTASCWRCCAPRDDAAARAPKWAIASGAGAKDGGVFAGGYAIAGGVGDVAPVDSISPAARRARPRCSRDCWR